MARSKSKNKTLAVGEKAHAGVKELQDRLGFKNHDETILYLLRGVRTTAVIAPHSSQNQ